MRSVRQKAQQEVFMVVLRTFATRLDAGLAKVVLEANGLSAMIASDDAGGMQPWMQGLLGVKLYVHHEDAIAAARVLDARADLPLDPPT
jgi:hypothetical protein